MNFIRYKYYLFMKLTTTILLLFSLIALSGCNALKYKKVSAKDFPPEPEKRIKKNMEEGRGFRIMDTVKKSNTTYTFASSNPLWKATLDTLEFMPLVSANYSGGIIITDWYSEDSNPNEAIKISVRFLTNEIRSDALDVNIFIKECSQNMTNCKIDKKNDELNSELQLSILKKASLYEKDRIDKYKKENPYILSTPSKEKN